MLISLQLVLASSSGIRKEGLSNYSLRFLQDAYDLLPLEYECKVWKVYSCPPPGIRGLGACEETIPSLMTSHSPIC